MKRLLIYFSAALFIVAGFSNRAAAGGSAIAKAMNDLRWGMNEHEVTLYLQFRIKTLYDARIKKASGYEKGQLEQEAQSRLQEIQRGRVAFNGQGTRWDNGLIAYEYTHNNEESILVAKDDNSTNFYFFINNSLWKWYKAFNREAFNGKNFKQAAAILEKNFGRGIQKDVERVPGAGRRPVIEWRDRDTRLRALDESEAHGRYCLVFEDLSMANQMAGLRVNADRRFAKLRAAPPKKTVAEEQSAPSETAASASNKKPKADDSKGRKSVFAQEARSETQSEYEARRDRIYQQRADAERKKYEQKMAEKRGKALDSLRGLENNDPLSGL